eukprot:GHVR01003544.1.p1 GENE.GHVR01003544.1~~GHVR01003544.1.p1  ORF type:complete len:440 (+),score=24.05 GHVR01003544.1:443-1762(+)
MSYEPIFFGIGQRWERPPTVSEEKAVYEKNAYKLELLTLCSFFNRALIDHERVSYQLYELESASLKSWTFFFLKDMFGSKGLNIPELIVSEICSMAGVWFPKSHNNHVNRCYVYNSIPRFLPDYFEASADYRSCGEPEECPDHFDFHYTESVMKYRPTVRNVLTVKSRHYLGLAAFYFGKIAELVMWMQQVETPYDLSQKIGCLHLIDRLELDSQISFNDKEYDADPLQGVEMMYAMMSAFMRNWDHMFKPYWDPTTMTLQLPSFGTVDVMKSKWMEILRSNTVVPKDRPVDYRHDCHNPQVCEFGALSKVKGMKPNLAHFFYIACPKINHLITELVAVPISLQAVHTGVTKKTLHMIWTHSLSTMPLFGPFHHVEPDRDINGLPVIDQNRLILDSLGWYAHDKEALMQYILNQALERGVPALIVMKMFESVSYFNLPM